MSLLFYWTGIVALVFQAWLTFASHSAIRKLLGYEFFKATHFIAVVIFMLTFFWHCDYTLTSWHYFIGTAAVYVPCYVYPWLRTFFEYGLRTKAHIKVEDNGFVRVTIPANFTWEIGQHCFLRFTGFGLTQALSAHPFTICSLPAISPGDQSFLVFYLKQHRGFTAKLYEYALQNPGAQVSVLVDGPYGGVNTQNLVNSNHLVVIAGGSGAGWTLPFIEQYIATQTSQGDGECKESQRESSPFLSLRVILASRDAESCSWYRQVVNEMLLNYLDKMISGLQVQIHRTSGDSAESSLPSDSSIAPGNKESGNERATEGLISFDELYGRPDLPGMLKELARGMISTDSLGVYVCGPDTMQNDVRNAVASLNLDILGGADSAGVTSTHKSLLSKVPVTTPSIMAPSNHFEKLSPEIVTMILAVFESAMDLQSAIQADPYILSVFLQNQQRILLPFRQALNTHFPGQNLTQAALVCRIRHMEGRFQCQDRAQVEQVIKPLLTSSPKPLSVSKLSLGALSELYGVLREADTFAISYSKKAWKMTQEVVVRDPEEEELPSLPMRLPLSEAESQEIQKAYLLFDAYRHSLCFSTNLVQDYGYEDDVHSFHIPWKFIYDEKLLCVRAFQAVFVFLFKEYEGILNQIHYRNTGPPSLPRFANNNEWQIPPFVDTPQRDRLQFIAYLCSQGYHQLQSFRKRSSVSQGEHILSLYWKYQVLKGDRRSCPMVVGADLEHSLWVLCCSAGRGHEFWTSGAFMWDMESLEQIGGELVWIANDLRGEF
ncbi:ferric cupric reductase transmembrane component 7 [Fusarium napiforme]|uniref:ferric-chelate reductase (NADPH) n=1 Tax=Fusarium napiforme TaxID=42672 RepID=A0A8H5JKC9_9HYPO|nr:ferric cupric reductase transmembrane component 7 [Fusarium napiforme]